MQREVYLAREAGERPTVLAKRIGRSYDTVKTAYRDAKKKIATNWSPAEGNKRKGAGSRFTSKQTPHNRLDVTDPEKAAAAMEAMSLSDEARGPIADLARAVGISDSAARALQQRMDGKYVSLQRKMGDTKVTELRDLAGYNAVRLLGEIADRFQSDPESIRKEKIRDLSVAAGIMIDKQQLLDGKPTQVLAVEHRGNMNDLMISLNREMERRGLLQARNPTTGQVDVVDAEYHEEPGSEAPGAPRR